MKQTWLLSCLGSLGKRKKTVEGKLNAMFSKEIRGRRREAKGKVAAAAVAEGEETPLLAVTAAKKRRRSPSLESASLEISETLESVETWDSAGGEERAAAAAEPTSETDHERERHSRVQGISKRGRKRRKRANSRAKAVAEAMAAASTAAQAMASAAVQASAQAAVKPIKGMAFGKRR